MATPVFAVVGEALVDIVVPLEGEVRHAPGGSPLNVAVGLARLGVDSVLITELGDDELGATVRRHVEASAVRLHESAVVPGRSTSTATARLDETGAASYTFDLSWTLGKVALPEDAVALHTGSIGAALSPGREGVLALVREAAESGLLVTFDPNARPAFTPDHEAAWQDVREIAAYADVVKMSDEDLEFLRPGWTPAQLADALLVGRTRLVVVTAGGTMASAFSRDAALEVASDPAEVTDTVGAGDSFMAALVAVVVEHGLDDLTAERLEGYVRAAHRAAAITVSRRGADPPRRHELPEGWPHL